jgi:Asp-tRNA(Asn)/Glu-tRNA(Gln) amidotransferase A subunit family amidase
VLPRSGALRIALCRTPMWDSADAAAHEAFDLAARAFRAAGARVEALELPAHFARLNDLSRLIMAGEGRTAFTAEYRSDRERLHEDFRAYVENRRGMTSAQLCEALDFSAACRSEFDRIAAAFDAVPGASTAGEAPRLPDKGDSVFQRMWTLLHAPCISLPVGRGPLGLPVGVTLAAGRYADARLLAAAAELRAG